jgi:transcriptional regulator of met regulon
MIIPGQSLTAEPKNAPYENPPEMNTEEDAVMWHLERLSTPDRVEALVDMLELGLDVVTLTEGVLRGAVLEGRHSIDISLIIAPVIHEFIVGTAEKVGIDFDEGLPDDTEQREDIRYTINENKARKMLEELGMEPEEMEEEEEMGASEESQMEEMQPMEAEAKPAGLMARPGGEV